MMRKNFWMLIASSVLFVHCGSEKKATTDNSESQSSHYDAELSEKLVMFASLPEPEQAQAALADPKVNLGYYLYYDTRLSLTGKNSCNSCHGLTTFGVDNQATSAGDKGQKGDRNSPTTLNAALHSSQFWDGRAKDVEEQAGMPILNPVEMNIPNKAFLVERLKKIPQYQEMFKKAFPEDKDPVSYDNLQKAIGAFERRLITPSRFDKYLAGDKNALAEQEKKGLMTFIQVGCNSCHNGALLGGNSLQKFGVFGNYWDETHSKNKDEGKFSLTKAENDKYIFKTPSLRNIEKTAPYFHDGSVDKLEEAVRIMAKLQLNKDLSTDQISDITAFLKTLTADIPAEYKVEPKQK